MNKQDKGNGKRGIEWTDYTWNPIGGCHHACRWQMPDGSTAICYAEAVANGVASHAYPDGFEHHYWNPARLEEPLKGKGPARIFLDSMSDLMGAWVPEDHIRAVLDVVRRAHWHDFQLLTKNAPRLLKFKDDLPPNLWVGVSMPPSQMLGHTLSDQQQRRYMEKALTTLHTLHESPARPRVLWLSLEPLSFDVGTLLSEAQAYWLDWLVIGAASNGRTLHQPDGSHVSSVLAFADAGEIPVFFKGNLEWEPHREDWPVAYAQHQQPAQLGLEEVKAISAVLDQQHQARVLEAVQQYFADHPDRDTIPRGNIVLRVSGLHHREIWAACDALEEAGKLLPYVARVGGVQYRLPAPKPVAATPTITEEQIDVVRNAVRGYFHRHPGQTVLAVKVILVRTDLSTEVALRGLRALVGQGELTEEPSGTFRRGSTMEKPDEAILAVLREQGVMDYPQLRKAVHVRTNNLYDTWFLTHTVNRLVAEGLITRSGHWTYALPRPTFDELAVRQMIRERLERRAGIAEAA